MDTSVERDIIIISLDEIKECQQVNNTALKIQLLQYCKGKEIPSSRILDFRNFCEKTCDFILKVKA